MDPQRTDSSSQDYTLISEGGKTEIKVYITQILVVRLLCNNKISENTPC